jgi:hypothetical protein
MVITDTGTLIQGTNVLSGQKKMRYLLDFTIPKPTMSFGMLLLDLKEQVISMIKLV